MEAKNFEINSYKYISNPIPARKSVGICYRLIAVLSEGMESISKLYELDKDGTLVMDILSHTIRDDTAINEATFDNIYTGNLSELMEALKTVVEFNFGDFLQGGVIGTPNIKTQQGAK